MRLTFRLRLPSLHRTRLNFCYRTYSPRLPFLPLTLGTCGPQSCQPHPPWTMPETLSGWTRPSYGMVLPTSCPRRLDRLHSHLQLLHQLVPVPTSWETGFSGSAFATAGIHPRLRLRLHSRHRKLHRTQRHWSCYPRLRLLPRLLYGRLVPRHAPCPHLYSDTASPHPARCLCCLPTVNTKNWYKKETDLWAEFGKKTPFSRKFSSKHSVKMPAVGSTPSFGRRADLRLEKETFGNT
jgi:hypothetical protein